MTSKQLALPSFSSRHLHVWRRNSLVWRKLAVPSMLGNLADPMIYMLGLGYGMGAMLTDVGGIIPAPYLARAHWVLVEDAKALTDAQARDLVARSHALVMAKLTKKEREAIGSK